MGHHGHIELTTNFYGITDLASKSVFNFIAAFGFIAIAVLSLLSTNNVKFRSMLGAVIIVVSVIPLLALFSSAMWIDSLGGFPAIGSGQGVIKYMALLAIGIVLVAPQLSSNTQKWISVVPVIIVLLWIGGMKFTLLEAKGIEDLVVSSPFMSWMYSIWDVQTTSNLIGIYDLVAVALLVIAMFNHRFMLPAILMSGAVFVTTQSFLFSWDAALNESSILSTGGHFLIKDLWYVINLFVIWHLTKDRQNVELN
ncbi:DUF417 family protein [Thalassotalea sp. M1531]|uniref:DUF417 family protein n=2 Tax=Thalassotalea algicola TaxID=2716224 RepID=A0A7Y0LF27_9GAMM|nr:DUF417 family protein [Thalassotalea algicola]